MTGYAGLSVFYISAGLLACASSSAVLTWLALIYARRRNLVDLPGQRRSHAAPTPRGGGIGMCVAIVVYLIAMGMLIPGATVPLRLVAAIALVALVGWIDDHRSLPIAARLAAQILAVAIFLWPLIDMAFFDRGELTGIPVRTIGSLVFFMVLGVWSINLHNFMDGIDGILASQAIFVFAVLTWLCWPEPNNPHALQIAICAAAVVGFLPFNFPRARIFMGDVGSGALGLLIFIAAIWQVSSSHPSYASVLIVVSAFVTDATCTLLARMFAGKRWYRPHREHLYQWMARARMSHASVVTSYAVWNAIVVLPMVLLTKRASATSGFIGVACVHALAIIVWVYGKRACLHKVKQRVVKPHA